MGSGQRHIVAYSSSKSRDSGSDESSFKVRVAFLGFLSSASSIDSDLSRFLEALYIYKDLNTKYIQQMAHLARAAEARAAAFLGVGILICLRGVTGSSALYGVSAN